MARSTLHVYRAVLLWMVLETAHGQTITGIDNFVLGRNKSLTCSIVSGQQVDPNAPFPLSWPINATKVVSVQEQTTTAGQISTYISTLTFTVDVKDNQVLFTCTARFNDSKIATWMLNVTKPPNKPIVTGPTEVIGDRNSSWTCVVDGGSTSAPNVFWQFGNGSHIMTNNVLTANVYTDENKLEINNVTAVLTLRVPAGNPSFDLGCVYVHGASSTQDTTYISINVTYPPSDLMIQGLTTGGYKEGESIVLTCSATGLPPPQYRWYRSSVFRSDGAVLNITSATSADNTVFKCEAQNTRGSAEKTVTVSVQYKPRPASNLTNETAVIGQTVQLTCETDSNPAPNNYTWYHNEQVVGTGSKTLTVTLKNNTMLGSYICLASNTQGQIDPPVVIYVTKKNDISSTGASFERTSLSTFSIVLISLYYC